MVFLEPRVDYFMLATNELNRLEPENIKLVNAVYCENAIYYLQKIYKNKINVATAVKHILLGYGKLQLFQCFHHEDFQISVAN